eukprot:6196541-Pleurochrysis_carterae.AAC.4
MSARHNIEIRATVSNNLHLIAEVHIFAAVQVYALSTWYQVCAVAFVQYSVSPAQVCASTHSLANAAHPQAANRCAGLRSTPRIRCNTRWGAQGGVGPVVGVLCRA